MSNSRTPDEVEDQILDAIEDGCVTYTAICSRLGTLLVESEERTVDRGLQRLRRRGKIAFNSKSGWRLAGD